MNGNPTMRLHRRAALAMQSAALAAPALANHPGGNLDARMMGMEDYFQPIEGEQAPVFELQDADGTPVSLSDFAHKVVVLHFIYVSCPDICPLHTDKIAEIQSSVNSSPMGQMVQFISISTDPVNDTPKVMKDYAEWHELDPTNWVLLTRRPDQADNATRRLAREYGVELTISEGSDAQMHGAVTHVIDLGGGLAGKFHGMEFENANLALYVSELISNAQHDLSEEDWWDRVTSVFRGANQPSRWVGRRAA